jgi:ABC-type dipeptide/oligopeptide/nickel transport system permease subunit
VGIHGRVVRAEVLRVRQADFVMASRALGKSRFGTLISHVIPNAIAPLLVVTTLSSPPPSSPRRRCRSSASDSAAAP